MKKTLIMLAICASTLLLGGCDFVRVIAGRPTSNYIEAKRALIARQQLLDKIAVDEAAAADSTQTTAAEPAEQPAAQPAAKPAASAMQNVPSSQNYTVPQKTAAKPADAPKNVEYKDLESDLSKQKKLVSSQTLSKVKTENLAAKYYIIIGSFSQASNAQNLVKKVESEGFDAVLLPYTNGFTAVGLHPCNDLVEANNVFQDAKKHSFCPSDAWILEVKR